MMLSTRSPRSRKGFTLIELLTVVAIIGILAGILIPTIGAAMTSAKKAKGRNQMRQYATAIKQYKAEYGYYPPVGQLKTSAKAELGTTSTSTDFIKAMSGRQPNGNALSSNDRNTLNPKGLSFCSFSEQEFYSNPATGDIDENQLADPFNNKNIVIQTDTSSRRNVVELNPSITTTANRTSANYTEVRDSVVVYTLYKSGDAESVNNGYETLLSWE